MQHNRELDFEDKPNYEFLIELMMKVAEKEGLDIVGEGAKELDWCQKGLQYQHNKQLKEEKKLNEENENEGKAEEKKDEDEKEAEPADPNASQLPEKKLF
mmetsp:Transcript_16182/g.15567  ORF Transcript_16182/g.15567 Transcript_16182/m.15567 type:complete len:100 (+) Transcript_16182:756-1055(+)